MVRLGKFCRQRLRSPKQFDPKSLRTVVRGKHRIVVGCRKGKYDREAQRCRVGLKSQAILHPLVRGKCQ